MKGLERLTTIRNISKVKGKNWIHKDIFRLLNKDDIWLEAYKRICDKENIVELDTKTLDINTIEKLIALKKSVVEETYQPHKSTEIYAYERGKKVTIIESNIVFDQVVQEVIKMILSSIFYPIFSEVNLEFKHKTKLHSVFHYVEEEFKSCDFAIEMNIENVDSLIDHKILTDLISKHIDDVRFINLIKKVIKPKVCIEKKKLTYPMLEYEPTSIIYPILNEIYLQELDTYVEYIKAKYSTNNLNRINVKSQVFIPDSSNLHKKPRLHYVRYGKKCLIGVEGDKRFAIQIMKKIDYSLLTGLNISLSKTKIINLRLGNISFLGYDIYLLKSKNEGKLRFDLSINDLLKKLETKGIIKSLAKGYKPISKGNYTNLEDYLIVSYFNNIWNELKNYYSGITVKSKLNYIHYLLHRSCALTLAHRHRLSCKKIFKKLGKSLTVYTRESNIKISFKYEPELKNTNRKWMLNKQFGGSYKWIFND